MLTVSAGSTPRTHSAVTVDTCRMVTHMIIEIVVLNNSPEHLSTLHASEYTNHSYSKVTQLTLSHCSRQQKRDHQ